ncbi:hypothetical protein GGI42DRAFT_353474 [Trichoderma sp. SZMC 28013]
MANTGYGPLRASGFGGMPIQEELRCEERFAHGVRECEQIPAAAVREFAMVAATISITDKTDWHIKVFNKGFVNDWREEAFAAAHLMSGKAWAWCITEFRDKANEYKQKQYTQVLILVHVFANSIYWFRRHSASISSLSLNHYS